MKYAVAIILLLAILLGIGLMPPKRYSYTGSVMDEFNQPIAAANLSFHFKGVDEVIRDTETDAAGRFSLMSHYQRLEALVVTKAGYSFSITKNPDENGTSFTIVGKKAGLAD